MDITQVGAPAGYGISAAEQAQASQRLPGNLEEMTQRLIQDKDEDGNGTLSALEICISEEAFRKADANGDSELDSSELMNGVSRIGPELGPPPGMPRPGSDDDDDDEDEDEENARMRALLDLFRQDDEEATQTSIDAFF